MQKQIRKRTEGFTIIEVLIVLAIAGLILLIVFLAVPALQRNSRNTQRKNDIASLIGSVSEYTNNNNGELPTTGQFSTKFTNANADLGYYKTAANIQWKYSATAITLPTRTQSVDTVDMYNYLKCNSSGTGATVTGATTRSVVALYDVEGSGGSLVSQCRET